MKKIILILLICLLPISVSAQYRIARMVTGSGTIGGGTWSCTDADVWCENWNGAVDCGDASHTNCNYTYTVENPLNGTVDFNAAVSGSITGQSIIQALDITDTTAAAQGPDIKYDAGGDKAEIYCQFYFNVITLPASADRIIKILAVATATNTSFEVHAYRTGVGAFKLRLLHYNNTPAAAYDDGATGLSLNTWYGVRVHWITNQVAAGVDWAYDTNLDDTFEAGAVADTGTANRLPRYFVHGVVASNVADLPRVQYLMTKVDISGYPNATAP